MCCMVLNALNVVYRREAKVLDMLKQFKMIFKLGTNVWMVWKFQSMFKMGDICSQCFKSFKRCFKWVIIVLKVLSCVLMGD